MSNALKFRHPSRAPRMRISSELIDGRWHVHVDDNGLGIPEEQRVRVLGMFQRLHTRDEYPGTGIGLTLVDRIVERHDGALVIASEDGAGTRFSFDLAPADEPRHDRDAADVEAAAMWEERT